jgi:hypothetical protein
MKTRTVDIKSDCAYIIPIGDLHVGDKAFGKESRAKLDGYIKWILEHDNARVILNGDLVNCATRTSKTSPFEQDMDLEEQISEVVRLLEPIKDRIIGAVMGNHERRIEDVSGFDPTLAILWKLGLDTETTYFKYTGIIKVRVGVRRNLGAEKMRNSYTVVFTHTTGGGKLIGSKLNRVDQMRESTVTNADVYIGSHNHSLSAGVMISMEFDSHSETVVQHKQTLVSAGGYLEWNDSYAEAMQLQPTKIGSPRIRLDGKSEKDCHVSL